MTDQERLARDAGELQQMLRQVRRRWRVRLLLQGLARVVLAGLGLVVITTVASRVVGSDGGLLAALRWPLLLALLAGLIAVAAYALLRRADDERIALYVEEHEPELRQALLSAIQETTRPSSVHSSPALVARVAAAAREAMDRIERGLRVERPRLRRSSGVLASVTLGSLLLVF